MSRNDHRPVCFRPMTRTDLSDLECTALGPADRVMTLYVRVVIAVASDQISGVRRHTIESEERRGYFVAFSHGSVSHLWVNQADPEPCC